MSNEFSESEVAPLRQSPPQSGEPNPSTTSPAQLSDLKDKIAEDLSGARDTIKEGAEAAVVKAKEAVSEQTNFAARQVGGIATALQKVGLELEKSDQSEVGRYARQIGSSVQSFAKQMEGRDLGEVATMAEDFGRKQPLAFLGIAALAGLAASRFLTASASRPAKASSRQENTGIQSDFSTKSGGPANG
ncbi:nutrient deprivation-induced protein [Rhizobium sp. P32RR-XVIII]|uniref:nutrient deprivation-induced protein n=1 Tax=Rhizobium sp. P32RR-XVIII TaxID=2726738 RepID=UPI001FEDC7C0|nr:nutrient deprivation-induced protein [Rhizobium sp. P32RR-XVIII]